jgi:acyl-CoA thioester hydrolase
MVLMPSMPLPDVEQVRQLPMTSRMTVGPDLIDVNGHMNVQHYFLFAAVAVGDLYEQAGLGQDYRDGQGLSLFTAEQHLRYGAEISVGSDVSVHPVLLRRNRTAVLGRAYVVDNTCGTTTFSMEIVLVHVSLETRRAVPFPARTQQWLDLEIEARSTLDWDPMADSVLWRD